MNDPLAVHRRIRERLQLMATLAPHHLGDSTHPFPDTHEQASHKGE